MSEKARLQRYEWEDYWIKCSSLQRIDKNAVGTALRLSMQVNWTPKEGKALGLNWANDLAAASVGIPRSTFRKHLKQLKATGCFVVVKGNLVPCIGDDVEEVNGLFKAFVEVQQTRLSERPRVQEGAEASHDELGRSRSETAESRGWTPFTEDSCSEDSCTEDLLTRTDASHPALLGGATKNHRQDPLLPESSNKKSSLSFLISWWRRTASKTPTAANMESVNV